MAVSGGMRPLAKQDDVPNIFCVGKLNGVDLYESTIHEIQQHLEHGSFTSLEYTKFCIDRIHAVNGHLEAVMELNPDALDIAAHLDRERSLGVIRGPLHGIPVLVKDNMATKDKMQTTAGSWALLGSVVPRDAHTVSLIRKAGAIIIGHANMSEWAGVSSRKYSSGYSPRGGQARNAYDLAQSPFGSSGGSAVSVSANIVPMAFGTETDTSIIGPAMINGIVGIKPTVGLTSRAGVVPISDTQDTIGPFGRTVADAVYGLDAMVGPDDRDSFTLVPDRKQEKSYASFMTKKQALKGAKFGVPQKRCWELVPEDQKKIASRVFDVIKAAGAELIPVDFPCVEERSAEDGNWDWELGEPDKSEITVCKTQAYTTLNAYLSELEGTDIKTVEDIIAYNEANDGTEGATPGLHPAYESGQDLLHDVAVTRGQKDETYHKALDHIRSQCRKNGIDAALKHTDSNGQTVELDALLLCDRKSVGQQLAAQAAYPVVCIPIGIDDAGLPVALNLQHTAWKEGVLIKWASAIEDLVVGEFGSRPAPSYRNYMSKIIPVKGEM